MPCLGHPAQIFSEIGRVKALHMEQVNDLESQIKKLKAEKSKTEEELGQLKTVHKGNVALFSGIACYKALYSWTE